MAIAKNLKNKIKVFKIFALTMAIASCRSQSVLAEGSVDFINDGGDRPYLLDHSGSSNGRKSLGPIPLKTVIKVYAKNGETINLGSSAKGVGSGSIKYRPPNTTTWSTCSTNGKINTRTEEINGPGGTSGYTPCTVSVTAATEGIWEIDFTSPDPNSDNSPNNGNAFSVNNDWSAQDTGDGFVTAWDVTVTNSSGTHQPGRAYVNSLPVRVPGKMSSKFVVLTKDGYKYDVNTNSVSPYTFILFSNDRGFTDNTTAKNPLYRSVNFPGGNTLETGTAVQDPNAADGSQTTNKMFFNSPDTTMPSTANISGGSTWLINSPVIPNLTNFRFEGVEGTPGRLGTSPLAGYFKFDADVAGSYTIVLDLNGNGTFGDASDRTLLGLATAGTNSIAWDGKDGTGTAISGTSLQIQAQAYLNVGEVHFPYLDAENNTSGIKITRINGSNSPDNKVFFNDKSFSGGSSAIQPIGVTSSNGAHSWGSNFGDNRGVDTWALTSSGAQSLPVNGTISLEEADLEVVSKTHSPTTLAIGDQITYTITVKNNGPDDIVSIPASGSYPGSLGANFQDTVPSQITGVTWTCAVTPVVAGNACGNASGSGNNINTTLTLKKDAIATYTVTGTISGSGSIANIAKILRPNDVNDPDDVDRTGAGNNSKTDTINIAAATQDYGDAPDSYGTDKINSSGEGLGANHTVTSNLRLGATTDVEGNGFPSTTANGDDSNNTDDEDGVTSFNPLLTGEAENFYKVTVSLANTTGSNAKLVGWIDFDRNGKFDSDEAAIATVANTTTADLFFTIPNDIQAGTSYARFRLTTDNINGTNPTGGASNGEVEDYQISITPVANNPDLLLVKRLTAIDRGLPTERNFDNYYVDVTTTTNDNASNWVNPKVTVNKPSGSSTQISSFLKGEVDNIQVKPDSEVEYTIYFLSNGDSSAKNVLVCDSVPSDLTFLPNSMGSNRGILFNYNNTQTTLTNSTSGDDLGYYFPPGVEPSTVFPNVRCNNTINDNGAVVVNLGNVPQATSPGNPANSYGFIRFRAKVK
jgi:uncharacterized repeat protein (TIGR01451 family)